MPIKLVFSTIDNSSFKQKLMQTASRMYVVPSKISIRTETVISNSVQNFFAKPNHPAVDESFPLSECLDLPTAAVAIPVKKSTAINTSSVIIAESQPPKRAVKKPPIRPV